VVGANGEMLGVLTVNEGIKHAEEAGLDLVEVSPNASPPVCKVMDYGKFKYEAQKKKAEAKKKQKVVTVKEIKVRPNIDTHDLEVKTKAMAKFLEGGDKVRVSLRFRGREMAHMNLGRELLDKIFDMFKEQAKLEVHPKLEGRQMFMVLAPILAK